MDEETNDAVLEVKWMLRTTLLAEKFGDLERRAVEFVNKNLTVNR